MSICFRPRETSSSYRCLTIRISRLEMPSHKDLISNSLLTSSSPLKSLSFATDCSVLRSISDNGSPRYKYRKAILNTSGGKLSGNFQVVISGASESFAKYGDLADKTNLCNSHDSDPADRRISHVFGFGCAMRERM